MAVRLHITHIPELDRLIALEYGRVDEGQPLGCWRPVGPDFGYLHGGPLGPELGFKVLAVSRLDLDADELGELWGPPCFDVPILGLNAAPAGEIVLAARALFGSRPSIGRACFTRAVEASREEAVELWRCCLEAGDMIAHYALGYTLYGLGRYREAYRHLRHYTELAPQGSWSWCWYGRAAEALGLQRGAGGVPRGDRPRGGGRTANRRARPAHAARAPARTAAEGVTLWARAW